MMPDMDDTVKRGNCFKLLAACFYEPDRELFLEEGVCHRLRDLLGGWASGAAEAASNMDISLRGADQKQLSIDHAALFIGPFELIAPPYGSVYLEGQRQVMGNSTMGVLQAYKEVGLSVDVKEAPDHIAIELEFMHFLCLREADSSASGNEKEAARYRALQGSFYLEALNWVPRFCGSIREGTPNPFYSDLADCLERFMAACGPIYARSSPGVQFEPTGHH